MAVRVWVVQNAWAYGDTCASPNRRIRLVGKGVQDDWLKFWCVKCG
jgi:hypothetical protein